MKRSYKNLIEILVYQYQTMGLIACYENIDSVLYKSRVSVVDATIHNVFLSGFSIEIFIIFSPVTSVSTFWRFLQPAVRVFSRWLLHLHPARRRTRCHNARWRTWDHRQ
jgi:hypothetical protein